MDILTGRGLSQTQRFIRAILFGLVASVLLGFLYGLVQASVPFEATLIYMLFGFLIAIVIQKMGRGVQFRFRVLAVVCYLVMILVGDILYYALLYQIPVMPLLLHYVELLRQDPLSILFKVIGAVVAFRYAL